MRRRSDHVVISYKFQFQYGAIRCNDLGFEVDFYYWFQFQYGAIRCVAQNAALGAFMVVSIPIWCD